MSSLVTFSDFKWVLWLSLLEPSVQPPTKMTVWQFAALWDTLLPAGLRCFCISLKPSLSTPVLVLGLPHCRCLLHPKFKWEVLWGIKKNVYLLVACARKKEVDGVSFFQQLLCIIPFVLGLIFQLLRSSELGTPCWVAEPSSHRVAGIAGKGMSLHFGGRRMFQSEFALLVCVDEDTYSSNSASSDFQAQENQICPTKGVDKMTFQDPSWLGGPGPREWPLLIPHLHIFPIQIMKRQQTVAAACSPCSWRLNWEAGRWGRRAWTCH